jgi:DHA1 family inner membrane transport protein
MGHAAYALWVFAVPMLLSAVVEAPLAVLSDRVRRTRVLRLGLAALSVSLALCAVADRPWILSLGLALAGASSGAACASAQGELVCASGGRSERAMSRWATLAAAGDVLAPLFVSAVLCVGGTYRVALLAVAGLLAAHAAVPGRRRTSSPAAPATIDAPPPGERLRVALARPRLWALLLGAAVCTLLDEIVVALAALRMARDLGATGILTAAGLTAFSVGSLAGAATTDAMVARASARAVLVVSACASAASLALVIAARSPGPALAALFVLGASAAPHYPLLMAAAYDVVPGRPGLVNAAVKAFTGLEVVLPLAAGCVAERHGLAVALALLSVQPVVVVLVSLAVGSSREREP